MLISEIWVPFFLQCFRYWNFSTKNFFFFHYLTFLFSILCAKICFESELRIIQVIRMVPASKWDCPTAQLLNSSFSLFSGLTVTLLEPLDCLEFLYTRCFPCLFTLSVIFSFVRQIPFIEYNSAYNPLSNMILPLDSNISKKITQAWWSKI